MKNLHASLCALALLSSPAFASQYVGKLDIGLNGADPSAIAFRELHDGMWLVGAQQQLWHLQNTKTDREVVHVAGFWATRLEGQDTAYGPSIGTNIQEAAAAAISKLEVLVPALSGVGAALPPWVSKLSAWTSIEVYGGYRPTIANDGSEHHWIYGIGGKVTIPLSAIYAWAKGTPATAGDSTHLGALEQKGL